MKTITKKEAIERCYKILKECIKFENIEDKKFIFKNLIKIEGHREKLGEDMYLHIKQFIDENIKPIVLNVNYFSFLMRDEFGSLNKKGYFEINSERSLEMMILMCEHTIELEKKLNKFAYKYLDLTDGK